MRRITIKYLVLILGLSLTFSFSCKNGPEQQGRGPEPDAASPNPAAAPSGKAIAPETYFKLELERLRLEKEALAKYLSVLKAADKRDPKLESSINQYELETALQLKELRDKYQVSFQDMSKTSRDPAWKSVREAYLAGHPELKKEMEALEDAQANLEKEIAGELARLDAKELTPPGQKPVLPGFVK